MALQNFSIEIYDTTLPAWEQVPLEKAQASTLILSYQGEDVKNLLMLPSTLEFTIEVNMAPPVDIDEPDYTTDGFFSHLFTGNETKFQVHLRDEDQDKILWRGHLLPDQYTEPYTQGTFYVKLTATDGLARLRGKTLPDGMYRGRSSVAHIIANCLKLTGMTLPIWVSQGIINAAPDNRFREINKWFHNLKQEGTGRPKDAFNVLQELLSIIGCELFQQDDVWYIVGWNQFYKDGIAFDIYSPHGVLLPDPGLVNRAARYVQFLATPTIDIAAPFKRVIIENQSSEGVDLIPDYVAPQSFERYLFFQQPEYPKQWKSYLNTAQTTLSLVNVTGTVITFEDWEETDDPVSETVYPCISKPVGNPLESFDYWIEPANQFYVKAGQKVSIHMELFARIRPLITNLDNENFKYVIAINTTAIYSNRDLGNILNLEINNNTNGAFVFYDAKLEIESFTAPISGYLLLRIYPIQDFNNTGALSFEAFGVKRLEFKILDELSPTVKERDIDFVTEQNFTVRINDVYAPENQGIILDDRHSGFTLLPVWLLPNPYFVEFSSVSTINFTNALGIQPHLIATVQNNITKLFLLRKDSDYYEYLKGAQLVTYPQAFYGFLYINTIDDYKIQAGDRIYYKPNYTGFDFEDTLERVEARQQWQKTEANTGTKRLHECLAELVHDIHPTEQIKLEGDVERFIFPMDRIRFRYKNVLRGFQAMRISNTLDKGKCRITAIEDKMQKVTDYE